MADALSVVAADLEDVVNVDDPTERVAQENHEASTYESTKCEICSAYAAGNLGVLTRCRQFYAAENVHESATRPLEDRIRTISKRIHLGNADMQYFEDLAFESLQEVRKFLPADWPEARKMREIQEACDSGRVLTQKAWETHMSQVAAARCAIAELNDVLARVHAMMWYSPKDPHYVCVFMPIRDVIRACNDLGKAVLVKTAHFARANYFVRPAIFAELRGDHLAVSLTTTL